MTRRNPLLDRDVGEQGATALLLASHQRVGSWPIIAEVVGFFSELLDAELHRVELRGKKPRAPCCLPPPVPPSPPSTPDAPAGSALPAAPPDLPATQRPWPGLDQLGGLQASGGMILGLIALFTSYDHISLGDFRLPIPQPWGIPLIAASVATALIDAQLATRARDRGAHEADRER